MTEQLKITAKVHKIQPKESGQGSKGFWEKQILIVETEGQYPKKICLTLWGEKTNLIQYIKEGQTLSFFINLESREYNNKWSTEVRVWKFETPGKSQPVKDSVDVHSESQKEFAANTNTEDDLPF